MTHYIFSYGSNLLLARLKARVPSARFVTKGALPGHELRWHKLSKDKSGKCDAFHTGNPEDQLWGGVFEIAAREKHLLDIAEGLGTGYDEKHMDIQCVTLDGQADVVQASLYTALTTDPSAIPYSWYKAFVIAGAHGCGLPQDHMEQLLAMPSAQDPDKQREALNRALLPDRFRDFEFGS